MINTLKPKVLHLANNDARGDGFEDSHLPLAQGDINFEQLSHLLVKKMLTIEVGQLTLKDLNLIKLIRSQLVTKS